MNIHDFHSQLSLDSPTDPLQSAIHDLKDAWTTIESILLSDEAGQSVIWGPWVSDGDGESRPSLAHAR